MNAWSESRRSRKPGMFVDFRFPIAISDFKKANLKIGNWQSTIGNEKSRAKQRGTSIRLKFFGFVLWNSPSCLAVCFAWPQVALTHHVFKRGYTLRPAKLSRTS